MVVDREMGSMRVLLTSPMPRAYLLVGKLISIALISALQAYVFLAIAYFFGVEPPIIGYIYLLPALIVAGLMLASLGLFISSLVEQLENFAGIMNFVIFPMFFLSSALYPLWKMREANEWLYQICLFNPFTYAVELLRFALYATTNSKALIVVVITTFVFVAAAIAGYNPRSGLLGRKTKSD